VTIDDGQEVSFYIAAAPRMFDAVRGKFRPMQYRDVQAVYREAKKGKNIDVLWIEQVAKRISEWDFKGRIGRQADEPVAITTKDIQEFCPPLLVCQLIDIVSGNSGGDEDPEASDDDQAESRLLREQAAANDSTVGVERETEQAKN